MRDIVVKSQASETKGHFNEIFKAIRDGHRSNDTNYIRICFSIILDHIIHLDEKCSLYQDGEAERLRASMKALQETFETGTEPS